MKTIRYIKDSMHKKWNENASFMQRALRKQEKYKIEKQLNNKNERTLEEKS